MPSRDSSRPLMEAAIPETSGANWGENRATTSNSEPARATICSGRRK